MRTARTSSHLHGGVCPGGLPQCILEYVCPGVMSAPVQAGIHSPSVNRMDSQDRCKYISLPQLRYGR